MTVSPPLPSLELDRVDDRAMIRDVPIIFSGPMIRALLDGRKTMTRRLAWKEPRDPTSGRIADSYQRLSPWQRVEPGDRMWVRETFVVEDNGEYRDTSKLPTDGRPIKVFDGGPDYGDSDLIPHYRATEPEPHIVPDNLPDASDDRTRWRSPIHMPRWASRLTLIVTATKIERLQSISEADALAEGIDDLWLVQNHVPPPRVHSFKYLWEDLHGAGTWAANPEVVCLSFQVIKSNIDAMPGAEQDRVDGRWASR